LKLVGLRQTVADVASFTVRPEESWAFHIVTQRFAKLLFITAILGWVGPAVAGGGMILSKDACIVTIGFYTAHFTGYQPNTNGNIEFCGAFPDKGETIMVLDYLHDSLSEVPVDFRIIRDVLGKGDFIQPEDLDAIEDMGALTVFYQSPIVKANATLNINYVFESKGDYIGIVTAGHPTNDNIYTSVFPFTVGVVQIPWPMLSLLAAIAIVGAYVRHMMMAGKNKEV
jgi:hypothetical protein